MDNEQKPIDISLDALGKEGCIKGFESHTMIFIF